jgi:cytochrome oxidase Cu insertion factor (SCO1/SenC/PrrC family)
MLDRRIAVAFFVAATAVLPVAPAQQPSRRPMPGDLKVGDVAPDFTIKDIDGKVDTTLSKLQGKPVVLIFGSCT